MNARRVLLFVLASVATLAAACSLNPQPFPPDTFDGSVDAAKFGSDAGGGMDTGSPGPAQDATVDGESDASDAAIDAPADVTIDAPTDATDDASDAPAE